MDRNLGALYAEVAEYGTQTFGLAYQYGRKDPFLGSKALVKTSEGSSYDDFMTMYPPKAIEIGNSDSFDMAKSIQQPYVRNVNGASRWCKDDVSWGAPHDSSSTSTSSPLLKTAKTLYDPCPVGWRTIEEAVVVQALGFDEEGKVNRPEGKVISVGGGAFAFEFTGLASQSGTSVLFPAAGISNESNSLSHVGQTVAVWGASKAKALIPTAALEPNAYYLEVVLTNNPYTSNFTTTKMGATLPVRCVKWDEREFKIVTTPTN